MPSLTVYDDIILTCPFMLASGLRARMSMRNNRSSASNGQIAVDILQDYPLHEYEFSVAGLTRDMVRDFVGIYRVTKAGAYGFLVEDPADAESELGLLAPYTTGYVGTAGLGFGVPSMRMINRYTALGSSRTDDRRITRPKATPIVKRGGTPITLGVNATLVYSTGVLTFVADASQAMTSITPGSSTVLNFANGTGIVAAMSVGQRVYIAGGVVGTGASQLEGKSHVVTAKGATSLTISTNTAGLTTAGGLSYKYPQASETLTWGGSFYVPVHFAGDDFDWQLARPGANEEDRIFIGSNVTLEEVPEL